MWSTIYTLLSLSSLDTRSFSSPPLINVSSHNPLSVPKSAPSSDESLTPTTSAIIKAKDPVTGGLLLVSHDSENSDTDT